MCMLYFHQWENLSLLYSQKISLCFCRNGQMLLSMVFCISVDLNLDKCCFIPPRLHSASAWEIFTAAFSKWRSVDLHLWRALLDNCCVRVQFSVWVFWLKCWCKQLFFPATSCYYPAHPLSTVEEKL